LPRLINICPNVRIQSVKARCINASEVPIGLPDDAEDMVLEVTVSLSVAPGEWESSPELLKYLRIQVVQCSSASLENDIANGNINFIEDISEHVELSDIFIDSLQKSDGSINYKRVLSLYYKSSKPIHLSYLVGCFVDYDSWQNATGGTLPLSLRESMYGKISSKTVFENGGVKKQIVTFFDSSGKIYVGPRHIALDGSSKTGYRVSDSLMRDDLKKLLRKWLERNTGSTAGKYYADLYSIVILEGDDLLRKMERLVNAWQERDPSTLAGKYYSGLKAVFDFYVAASKSENILTQGLIPNPGVVVDYAKCYQYDHLCNISSTSKNKSAFTSKGEAAQFSTLLITTAAPPDWPPNSGYGPARMMFSVNHVDLIKGSTPHSCLFENTNPDIYKEMLTYIHIKRIDVYRQRMDIPGSRTKLLISAKANNGVISGTKLDNDNNILASIRELDDMTILPNPFLYRHFTIEDNDVPYLNYGIYQYSLVITISDNVINFIKKRIRDLSVAIRILKEYDSLAQLPCSYIPEESRFTESFISKMKSRSDNKKPWLIAPSIYADVLRCFYNIDDATAYDLAETGLKFLIPTNSSPSNISAALRDVQILQNNLNSKYKIKPSVDRNTKSAAGQKSRSMMIKLEYSFSNAEELLYLGV